MDTEFDKQCAKAIVALNYSRGEIKCLGLAIVPSDMILAGG